jgi:hypothetical protein
MFHATSDDKICFLCISYLTVMSIKDSIKLIVYRYADKGVEVLMHETDCQNLALPNVSSEAEVWDNNEVAESDTILIGNDKCFALEADYHLRETPYAASVDKASRMFNEVLTSSPKSKYVALKEIFKSVLPNEYALLKEFKDILSDRNSIRNL